MSVKEKIQKGLCELGVKRGDLLLIHSSYKSLGEIEGGAAAFFDAVISYLGEEGTLVLPAFSFGTVGKENPHFNRLTTPSCVGYLTEYFRAQVPGVLRSMHATHSLSARGRLAEELVCDHYLDETPVGKNSPLAKLPQYNGKILFLGCSTDRNTSMHGVEELATPPYLFLPERTTYYLLDGEGGCIERESLCHNFVVNGKHIDQRYSRIAELLPEDKIKRGKILDADCVLMDSAAVWEIGAARLAEDPYYFVEI